MTDLTLLPKSYSEQPSSIDHTSVPSQPRFKSFIPTTSHPDLGI